MKIRPILLCVFLTFCVFRGFAFSQDQPAVQLPDGVKAVWDVSKAAHESTPTRESICINGLWQWQPAKSEPKKSEHEASASAPVTDSEPPTENWGWFKVPGCWPGITDWMQKDSQRVYAHPSWKDTRLGSVKTAWYQREIEIPENWKDRRILLKADYVMSRAVVFIDGKRVGEILFPAGELDLTGVCEPGKKYTLSLEVTALPLADVIAIFGDTNAPKQGEASVPRRGLCGDLFLVSEPKGARIVDVRVETSVRNGEITVYTKLENINPDERCHLSISIGSSTSNFALWGDGFKNGSVFVAKPAWKPEKLWDIHTPENMYEMTVSIEKGLPNNGFWPAGEARFHDVAFPIRFGFREFWIDGRDLYLNGSRIWLSCIPVANAQVGAALANYAAAKESLLRLKSIGVNFVYMCNYDCNPGSYLSFREILKAADDVGMLVALTQPHFGHYDWSFPDAETQNGYARLAKFFVREAQNHPSVVFYTMSHNGVGYAEDMNPDLMDGIAAPRNQWEKNASEKAIRAEAIVRRLDSSRIVYHHSSGNLGVMHDSNFYVNWVPVQEMCDWFEHWAKVGVKPMFTCEYGVPFTWDWAMYRGWYNGVREFGSAPAPWEFCNAEWNAQFLGDAAFQIGEPEKKNLRWEAKQFHALFNDNGKVWHRWDYPVQIGSQEFTDQDPVLAKYITDNWRAFRTWGLSINSFWEHGRLWSLKPGVDKSRKNYDTDWDNLQRPGFSPDFQDQRYERIDLAFERDDWIPSPAAEALMRNNGPLLGYIAGKDGAFTSKDHNFLPGETIEKQLVMINNTRQKMSCGSFYGIDLPKRKKVVSFYYVDLETGNTDQIPIQTKLPDNLASGEYDISAGFSFGYPDRVREEDTFTIHVMPPPEKIPAMNIALFDPKGETAKLLDEMGVKYRIVKDANELKVVATSKSYPDTAGTSNLRPERPEHNSPGQGVLAAALGHVAPQPNSRPERTRQLPSTLPLPLQGGRSFYVTHTQGDAALCPGLLCVALSGRNVMTTTGHGVMTTTGRDVMATSGRGVTATGFSIMPLLTGILQGDTPSNKNTPSNDILIIGKDALDISGDGFDLSKMPDGMKVIVFEQTAQTLEKRLGFRTAQYGLRQVFRRVTDHPLLHNIADENLRDWRGEATLLPPRLEYTTNEQVFNGAPTVEWCGIPVTRMWRCGNRGNVASVLIEKPACGDFLPILDGGFSMQYSPLMEYRQGKGMILFCQLDVTGRTENDPAATQLVGNMLRYLKDWKGEPKRTVVYIGNEEYAKFLEKMGVSFVDTFLNIDRSGWGGSWNMSPRNYVAILAPGQNASKTTWAHLGRSIYLKPFDVPRDRVLSIGLNQDELKVAFPEITVENKEHISTWFEPFGVNSPLRGIGPADLHNRDPKNFPLVTGGQGVEVVGDGILAVADEGRTVICGMAPWQFSADEQSFKRTFRRTAFTLSRILGNMNIDMQTPLPGRFHGQVGKNEQRWLDGLYLDKPVEWDDPYRFFRW